MKYAGIIVMILGAILLLVIAFTSLFAQSNVALSIGLAAVVIGYILHIVLDKYVEAKR